MTSLEEHQAVIINQMTNCVIELLDLAEESLEAIGGCDHNVGICCCGYIRVIENASELLQKVGIIRPTQTPWQTGHRLTDEQIRSAFINKLALNPGTFLTSFCLSVMHADEDNFRHLRPLARYFIWKYKIEIPKDEK